MRNIYSQPDALAALKTRLEALDRAGGRRVGAGVRGENAYEMNSKVIKRP